jgi:hypothetical protein
MIYKFAKEICSLLRSSFYGWPGLAEVVARNGWASGTIITIYESGLKKDRENRGKNGSVFCPSIAPASGLFIKPWGRN